MDSLSFEVRRGPTRASLDDSQLLLRSLGIRYRVGHERGDHVLFVAEVDAVRALHELRDYEREEWEPEVRAPVPPRKASGWGGAAVYAVILLGIFILERSDGGRHDLRSAGVADSGLILAGEWWRCVTALTLHLDEGHVVGNIVFGGIFGALLAHGMGAGVGWWTILLAGGLGNASNAWLHGPGHYSVGASTAVFAALGALVAWQWTWNRGARMRWFARWSPIVMGVVLLSYLGTGGERTDVLAHVTGFVAGALLGWLQGRFIEPLDISRGTQTLLAWLAPAALLVPWGFALGWF